MKFFTIVIIIILLVLGLLFFIGGLLRRMKRAMGYEVPEPAPKKSVKDKFSFNAAGLSRFFVVGSLVYLVIVLLVYAAESVFKTDLKAEEQLYAALSVFIVSALIMVYVRGRKDKSRK